MSTIEGQAELLAREQAARTSAEAAQRRLAFLAEASGLLASSLDYQVTLTSLARLAVPYLTDWCTVHVFDENGALQQLAVEHIDPQKVTWANQLQHRYPPDADASTGLHNVVRTGISELIPIITDEMLAASAKDPEHLRLLREVGISSLMIVPLVARNRTLGAISFVAAESGYHYDSADLALAEDLAHRAGIAVDNARLYREAQLARETLRISEMRFRTMIEQSPLSIQIFSPSGEHLQANQAWEQLWGTSRDALKGYNILADEQLVKKGIMPYIEQGFAGEPITLPPVRYDPIETGREGRPRWVRAFIYPVRGTANEIREVVLVLEDVSIQIHAEEDLQRSRDQLEVILDGVADGITAQDHTGRLIYANDAAARTSGFPSAEAMLATPAMEIMKRFSVVDENDQPLPLEEFPGRRALQGDPHTEQLLGFHVLETGEKRWSIVKATPVFDKQGQVQLAINIFRDITGQRRAEEEMRFQAHLLDAVEQGIIATDLRGRIIYWNRYAETLYGWSSDEVMGRNILEVVPAAPAQEQAADIMELIKKGESWSGEIDVQRRDGSSFPALVTDSPVYDRNGTLIGIIGVSIDISERKRAEFELKHAKEVAEAADQAKGQFLAVLSHELRTPLTPVMTTVESLATDERLDPDLRSSIEVLRRNVELETRLINDLLDVTRIAKGKLQLEFDSVDAHTLLDDVIDICSDDIRSKQLLVMVDLQAAQHYVRADSGRLHQVFWNIIKNAVKFTPEGGKITVRSRNTSAGELLIEVTDTGIGIEPEMVVRIFDAFEQGERTVTRRFGGLGLGLAISKTLIDMHSGKLSAQSHGKDRGATFTVELATIQPVRPMSNGTTPELTSEPKQGTMRILIVDDHADTSMVMKLMLERRGYSVITADSVQSALKTAANEQFDLVISDIGLPDGSGLELIQKIKVTHSVPAIALSGFGMDEDLRKSKEAGFSMHLIKPVSFQKLQAAIEELTSKQRS